MRSTTRFMYTVVVASSLLLISSPLAAALRSKPGAIRFKSHSVAPMARHRGARGRALSAKSSRKSRFHGQQSIDQARTLEIQQALIREHYLAGEATGEWDQPTRDALTRFQSDNHWQTKMLPDARALILLGLGPSQQNLLNPETAVIAMPYPSGLDRSAQGGVN